MTSFYTNKYERVFLDCRIEFFLDLMSDETFEGIIDNISEAGFCLITSTPLHEGQEITIRSLMYFPSQTAKVCWIKPEKDVYRLGMKFM